MWEQFNIVSMIQKYWADNQVSATVKFNPDLSEKENKELETLYSRRKNWQEESQLALTRTSLEEKVDPAQIAKAIRVAKKVEESFEALKDTVEGSRNSYSVYDFGEGKKLMRIFRDEYGNKIKMWELRKITAEKIKDNYKLFTEADIKRISELETKKAQSEVKEIEPALNHFQYGLKGISLLPKDEETYPQMPFESITKEEYFEKIKGIKPIDFSGVMNQKALGESGCGNDGFGEKIEELLKSGSTATFKENGIINLFTTDDCEACEEVKQYLIKEKIPWQEINIKTSEGKEIFTGFYKKNRNQIKRDGKIINFPIVQKNSKVFQGLEKIMEHISV